MEKEIRFNDDGTAEFQVRLVGDVTQQTYLGKFKVFSVMDPFQILNAGKRYRDLLGVNPAFASETELNLAFSLAQLEYRILEAPPFWNNGRLKDLNVIMSVFDLAIESEEQYRLDQKKRVEESLTLIKSNLERLKASDKNNAVDPDDLEDELDISEDDE